MEAVPVYQLFAACFAFLMLHYTWKLLDCCYFTPKKLEKYLRKQGIKGNSYNLIVGDSKEMGKTTEEAMSKPINLDDDIKPRILLFTLKTITKYGGVCLLWQGATPRVIIRDVGMIKEVMNKYNVFTKPTNPNPMLKSFIPGLPVLEKDKWAKHRKIINPAFHFHKLKLMIPAFEMSCYEVLEEWDNRVSDEGYTEIDVWGGLESITSDAISRTAFGSSYKEGRRIFQLQKEQARFVAQLLQSLYIPGYRFLPTKRNKRMKEIEGEIRGRLVGLIGNRIGSIESGRGRNEDLLSIMLESNLNEISSMSMDDMIGECKSFYFAGRGTISSLLSWTLVLLGRHTEWQTRARQEVLTVFANNKPTFDLINHLKITTMILHEVLRLYPPSSTLVRRATEDTDVGKLRIPAGVDVEMPIIMLHHDPEIWGDDAMEFNPQRFNKGVAKAQKCSQNSYFPFGWGPRLCIGQNFALMEAKVVLSMILQRFSFELSTSYVHAPCRIFSLQPQYGVQLLLRKFDGPGIGQRI